MNPTRIRAIARKEFIHIGRDPRSLGMAIFIPMLLLLLFGYALTLDVDRVPTLVWDQSNTPASRELVARFEGSRYFDIVARVTSYEALTNAIDGSRALAGLVIPVDFGRLLATGREAPVQWIVDGSDSNTAGIATGYATNVVQTFSQGVALEQLAKKTARIQQAPLDLRPRVWFNPDMESRNYIIPGLIAVIMMVIAALLTSLTVAREWERGTMEQLISTPVKGVELIFGKLLPYFLIGLFDVALAVIMGQFLFQVPLRGSVVLLFAMAAIFLLGALSMGILISVLTKNQLLASQLAMVTTFLPSFLLSGFMYAIGNMPKALQVLTHVIPARYFVHLLKGIYLKGLGLTEMAGEALLLTLFGIVMFGLAVVKFKKRLA